MWEFWNVARELKEKGDPGIDDEYMKNPSLWSNGLLCADAVPPGHSTIIWCHPLEGDNPMLVAASMAKTLTAEQKAAGSSVTVRHTWPLDLFKAKLAHLTGEHKLEQLDNPNAKIFVMGSAYTPKPGHPYLDPEPNILCVRTAEKMTFLEPGSNPATWKTEAGRQDYVLMAAIVPNEPAI